MAAVNSSTQHAIVSIKAFQGPLESLEILEILRNARFERLLVFQLCQQGGYSFRCKWPHCCGGIEKLHTSNAFSVLSKGSDHKGIPRRYSQPRPPWPPSTSTLSPMAAIKQADASNIMCWSFERAMTRFPRPSVISCMVLKPCFRRSCIDFKAFGHGLNRTQWNIHFASWAISGPQSKHPSFCSSLSTSHQWPATQKIIILTSQSGFKMFEMDRKSSPELHVINKYHQFLFALESISDLTNSSVTATLSHKSRRVFCIGKTRLFEAKGWA